MIRQTATGRLKSSRFAASLRIFPVFLMSAST
jgi:hypothetical protein